MNKFRVSIHDGEMPDGAPVALEALDIATALTIADINVGAGDAEIWDGGRRLARLSKHGGHYATFWRVT
ncbi:MULTISPECIES: hypothetical protein [Erythrobacter]|jgi:hypothetical protein|uniref:Uncharacterized protein n=1 Tax=Erythrobacter aureus TaxID=2182384 RepID=A0A345YD93_9SPHN|nr:MULTISPECIES: hypothetical protein [Erythrobacter]AXK41895.1 hypothetical protein DVR09_05665 [Erythrobacter aureus]MCF8882518.1 hypothetical protein [Erythrobacter sp. SN021]|tara:strand:- start:2712 stop:2918 length:207 start_codon:yes stop_codon:yes gene_type:complete